MKGCEPSTPLDCDDGDDTTTDLCTEATACLHCDALAGGRLALSFPTTARPGRFTTRGTFTPPPGFVPEMLGTVLLLHDGAAVFQFSAVAAASVVTTPNGRTARFEDRGGTLADGLQRLTVTRPPGRPASFRARGLASGPPFGSDTANRVTLISGAGCVSAPLACATAAGGRTRRCR